MSHKADVSFPLARSGGLLVEHIGDETVVLDTETREAHCLSPLAAAVFAGADGRTRVEDLAAVAGSAMDDAVSVEQVDAALAQLDERGLLDRPTLPADRPSGISRRQLVRRTAGATAAISAVPLVTSIATPAFAQASPGARCPQGPDNTATCVSQAKGDEFCACNNVCPPGSPGAGGPTSCTDLGLTPPYFDSCFCAKCPTTQNGSVDQGDISAVPPSFLAQFLAKCPDQPFDPQPCSGDATQGGCNNSGSDVDGVCVPNSGDSSETCINDPSDP